jgi:hypothetical protein
LPSRSGSRKIAESANATWSLTLGTCKDRGYAFLISQDLPSKPASITGLTALIALERISIRTSVGFFPSDAHVHIALSLFQFALILFSIRPSLNFNSPRFDFQFASG